MDPRRSLSTRSKDERRKAESTELLKRKMMFGEKKRVKDRNPLSLSMAGVVSRDTGGSLGSLGSDDDERFVRAGCQANVRILSDPLFCLLCRLQRALELNGSGL